jgi:pimeloyl-ACP methyl ester carboxylesterase
MSTSTYPVALAGLGEPAAVTVAEAGAGRPFLLLHGGAGPHSFLAFGDLLARERPARVLTPTHPGWNGTPRPAGLTDVRGLAELYVALLDQLDLTGVTVVGNSIGGWIAAEIALLASPRVSGVVIVNGVGITVPGHPVADFFSLTPAELTDLSYHEPDRFRIDPAALPDAQRAVMAANRQAIAVFAGDGMADPALADRLAAVTVPTCVLWGQSDRIVDPEYGKAYAAAIPGAVHRPLAGTGHLPQLETPQLTLEAIWDFAS